MHERKMLVRNDTVARGKALVSAARRFFSASAESPSSYCFSAARSMASPSMAKGELEISRESSPIDDRS
jgi:hypothetical protein